MENIKNSCLICLTTKENDFDHIFLTNSNNSTYKTELALMYEDVFNLQIYEEIDFPQFMCPYCTLQLKLLSKFKKKAMDSYTIIEKDYKLNKCPLKTNTDEQLISEIIIEKNISNLDDIHEENEEILVSVENDDNGLEVIQEIQYDDFSSDNIKINEDEFYEIQFLENDSIKDNTEDITIERETEEPNNNDDDDADADNEIYDDITILSNFSPSFMEEEIYEEYTIDSNLNNDVKLVKPKAKKITTNINKNFKKFQCADCNITFDLKIQLADHRKEKHPPFSCEICSKKFLSHDSYTSHMKVHMGLPGFKCDECGKTFNQKQHLTYHTQNYHSNERNFQCNLCSKKCLTISDLKIHLRVHSDERRYECDVCHKKFRANTHMTNHRYTHFEKCIECPHCHLKYASPSTLKTHIRSVHEGLCPYECRVCRKKFKRKHHLITHLKTHRKKLPENNEDIIIDGYVQLEIKKENVYVDEADNVFIDGLINQPVE